jgi:uncharacterized FlaG/YvyC family protein
MTITPVLGLAKGLPSLTAKTATLAQATPNERAKKQADQLACFAAARGLEVHLQVLPDTATMVIRLVDPRTNRVEREFPSEDLARVLAAIRARPGARLDQTA